MYPTSIAGTRETGRKIDKIDIINDAYSQLRISGLTSNPSTGDLELALSRLEDMAAEWESQNIIVGYNFQQDPDPNDDSGIQPAFKLAFSRNLAVALIADFNKQVPQSLMTSARGSLSSVISSSAASRLKGYSYPDRMPIGSGNRNYSRWARFFREKQIPNTTQSNQIFIGDITDFIFNFDSTLKDNEYIETYDLQIDSGLKLISSSLDDDENSISYRIEATAPNNYTSSISQITAIINTSEERVLTSRMFFTLTPRGN
ncbi:MAG: packaged DNA stabilization gp4 family protein [Proteobacteria bacterium]|nr:packaged DNA stabilization gp4 family protein [Pseudomonadota bacterium]